MTDHCAGKATDLVRASAMGRGDWVFRYRTAMPPAGGWTTFASSVHTLTFNHSFYKQLDTWARNVDAALREAGRGGVSWWGEVGSMACHRPTEAHNRARGLDLCAVALTDGSRLDANQAPTSTASAQRAYLGLTASLRRFFSTVLTRHYNAAHRDHIHVDDLLALAPIRSDKHTDTTLVQSAANLLGGERLVVDGVWGSQTQAAYQRLVDGFGLSCTDPSRNLGDALLFLQLVSRTALADKPLGTYGADVCRPDSCTVAGLPLPGALCP